ncbi:UPF0462 protein C4orf33 homolog [Lineus longissimus]|uniref:UPF0462 protein C4orf33 homolog n=1 Tax=Lineus longissimus TaxID=88925 RepID=UPI002B4D35DD
MAPTSFDYTISKHWDGTPQSSEDFTISIKLEPFGDGEASGVKMSVSAPFYNSPPNPGGEAGEPFPELWDHEVVEAFFLSEDGNNYLEVELCPHGQHLVLLLSGTKNMVKDKLPLKFEAQIEIFDQRWTGVAEIPIKYFPQNVTKFNAYAIHGADEGRTYEALYPAPTGKYKEPDFHRLEYFQPINFQELVPSSASGFWNSKSVMDL